MNNIVFDFRHNYVRGERMESQEIVYQYDEGRVIEAYVPEQEGFVLNVGYESDTTLYVVEVDSTTADTEGGYKILATLPDTFLTRHGNLLVYVIAGDDEVIVTTYEGVVPVLPKAVSEDYVVPTEQESSILARCAAAANASETAQGTAEAKALVAEGYALGTQNGTAVSSGTYYHNNAEYHSDQSAASALVSEGYATGKQNGTDVSSGSPYYENSAKYYAQQAASSLNGVLRQSDIVDNATTADATKVASANVAKGLKDSIDAMGVNVVGAAIPSSAKKYFTSPVADAGSWYVKIGPVVYLCIWSNNVYTTDFYTLGTLQSGYYPDISANQNPIRFNVQENAYILIGRGGIVSMYLDIDNGPNAIDRAMISFVVF